MDDGLRHIISEKDLIDQIKEGKEEAFRYIYDQYYVMLCTLAKSYLKDSYLSETVVGDVIFNIWKIRDKFDLTFSLKSYLVRSVKNSCINYLKKEYVRNEIQLDQIDSINAIEELFFIEDKHPLDDILNQELQGKILKAIDNLPKECGNVFRMSRMEDKKYEEIAHELNISINTVKYHMKNAIHYLKEELKYYILIIMIFILTSKFIC